MFSSFSHLHMNLHSFGELYRPEKLNIDPAHVLPSFLDFLTTMAIPPIYCMSVIDYSIIHVFTQISYLTTLFIS